MGLSSISFSGLGSGIDTNSIIDQLLTVERRPESLIKLEQQRLQQKQTAYNGVSAQLIGLQSTSYTLNALRAFDLVTANSSDTTVATVSAQTGAQTGAHSLTVTHLAQAQKVSSTAQSSQTAPLGYTGQIIVNGKAINVQASDSLQTLAANINAAQPGVNASIISPSANQFYLTFASTNTGLQGQISLSDTAGGAFLATTLGLFDGTPASVRHAVSGTVSGSDLFQDSATSIGTLEGQTAPASGNAQITIGGTTKTIAINLGTDTLSSIAASINTAFGSSAASVVSVTDPLSNTGKQQLQITGATAFVDDKNVLANLGILQRNYGVGRQLTAAQDAQFTIDTLPATRATNSFSDAISGVTITLLKESASATLSVGSDTATIKTNINTFVKAYNDTIDGIASLSQFDGTSGQTGPLFGDVTSQSIVSGLVTHVSDIVPGLPSNLSLLSQIGITLDQSDHLAVDDAKLSAALTSNLQGVAQLFRANGVPSNSQVQFVSGSENTQPSGAAGYAVHVTVPAAQATVTAGTAQTTALAQDEVLTFGGPLFGTGTTPPLTGGRQITLHAGSSLDDVISQINGDSVLGPVLSASKVGGKLTLTTKQYGASAQFAVSSAIAGASDSSGLGTSVLVAQGQDVQGTINGESATGIGQFLTGSQFGAGNVSNGKALGLQLRVTVTAAGDYGAVTFTNGVASTVKNYITSLTDGFKGVLTTAAGELQNSIDDYQKNIDDIEARLKDEETTLRQQFTAMEVAVVQIKQSSAGLAQLALTTSK